MGGKIPERIKKDLGRRIKSARGIIFFLDYDGTLTPIRKSPLLAKLDKEVKTLLKKLSQKPSSEVFIITGRILKDIKSRVGVKSIYYIGNHGIELEGKGMRYINPLAKALKPAIQKCHRALVRNLRIRGIVFENKIYTLSMHYRMVKAADVPRLKSIFYGVMEKFKKGRKIKATEGKKVLEVRPRVRWDKGEIIKWVLGRKGLKKHLPICIGDDKTDEDAFRAIAKKGVGILVSRNPRKTEAKYRLRSPREVIKFLNWCLNELVD